MMPRLLMLALTLAMGATAEFKLAPFNVETTVPIGHALMGGGIKPADRVVDPLFARGVVLLGGEKPVVLISIDWCEIRNDAYDRFREVVAEAAGTARDHVLISSVHVHDAPIVDFTAQKLLDAHGLPKALCDSALAEAQYQKVANAIRESIPSAQTITHYGTGAGTAIELACNRRVKMEDGTVHYNRTSATADPVLRAAEAGDHDQVLRTLSFWNGDTPIAALHAFSIHPMSYYGKGGVSADFVGMARHLRATEQPGVLQVYFSGCSGDTIAGKWNDGNPANRSVLAKKLHAAMVEAWNATTKHPLDSIRVRVAAMHLEPKTSKGYSEAEMQAVLADSNAKTFTRILAAMGLSWRMRVAAGQAIDVPAVDFGKAKFLLMPAESFVGYQLMAQQLDPENFVITAGYGESAPGYIPTAFASSEGFNDAHDWNWVAPTVEEPMKRAMAEALGVTQP
ncbi:MAG TPA: hypothetical protein PLJ47_09215 [Candidatus Hydrogenedentes bacterium]|nr:hypothetical protein [Candidatus Hydrogenedentota bacterium]HRK34761.1 hypothetical protein [Candidatus Hydrogenedentota bacterium]